MEIPTSGGLSLSLYMRLTHLVSKASAEQLLTAKDALLAENWHEVERLLTTKKKTTTRVN